MKSDNEGKDEKEGGVNKNMARPRKSGLEYFPFDVDFFSDKKIRILKSRFGADGITIYIYILCEVYKNGYYITLDEDYEFIIADELGMSSEKVKQVLKFLLERSLLDSTLFQSDTIITSLGIQRRFQEAVKSRALKSEIEVDAKTWLLSEEETQPFIKVAQNPSFSEKNPSYSEKNPSFSEKNATKKSKVKESKEKESKENTPPISPSTGEVEEVSEKPKSTKKKKEPVRYYEDDELNAAFTDFVSMRIKLKRPMTDRAIKQRQKTLQDLAGLPFSEDALDVELAIKIIDQSISNCWLDFYALTDKTKRQNSKTGDSKSILDEWRNA